MAEPQVEAPKETALKDVDEIISMPSGAAINTLSAGEKVKLTRKIAIVLALEEYSDAERGDKFKVFDLGIRFSKANGRVLITPDECDLIELAIEKSWPQPGIYVPLCRWLEGA